MLIWAFTGVLTGFSSVTETVTRRTPFVGWSFSIIQRRLKRIMPVADGADVLCALVTVPSGW